MPIPDKKDLKRFCELDEWEKANAENPDHDRYRKQLEDGTLLKTKVSRGRGPVCRVPALWTNIWRHQLGLKSEDEFWAVLADRTPAPRGEPVKAEPEPQMEAWLFEALIHRVGVAEGEVRRMSYGEALARWLRFCEGEQPA